MNKVITTLLATTAAMLATGASAATVTYSTSADAPNAGAIYSTFNNRTLGSTTQTTGTGITVSFTNGGAFVQGSVGGQYAAPAVSATNGAAFGQTAGADATTFISTATGTATLAFATPTSYVGLLWGSIDSYNTLQFNFADGTSQNVLGSVFGALADTSTSRYVNFNATSSAITSIVASSSINAFEIDNVAFGSAVPEAATWAMMMVGLGVAGGALRRRRVSTSVRFA